MGRPLRVLVEGGVYHVYNRVTRGEPVFADEAEAGRFVARIRKVKLQDGFSVLAWCVMPNHYHLAVRLGSVPLSRSLQVLHQGFTRSYNGRHGVYGPFWQGRYKAKPVQDPRYLMQLVVYIHSNPRAAGITEDVASYHWCGHRELLQRRSSASLLDTDEMLLTFGEKRRAARRSYLAAVDAAEEQDWFGGAPGSLPWWRLGRPRLEADVDEDLVLEEGRLHLDVSGRGTAVERPALDARAYLELAAESLGLGIEALQAKTRAEDLNDVRERIVLVGVERYRLPVKNLAEVLGRSRETVSRWLSRATRRRGSTPALGTQLDDLDRRIASLGWRNIT